MTRWNSSKYTKRRWAEHGGDFMKTKKLVELAKTIRSKNAGTDKITFDIIFREKKNYELIKKSRVLTKKTVAKLFSIPKERISDFVEFDPAYAVKFTILRT